MKMIKVARCSVSILLSTISAFSTTSLSAAEYAIDLGLDINHSDNIRKRSTNEQSGLEQGLSASVAYHEQTEKIDVDVKYSLRYESFNKDNFDNELTSNGRASINFKLIPNRVNWNFSQSQRSQTIDSFDTDTPNNVDERSIFQTGPSLMFQPSSVDTVSISGSHVETKYEKSSFQDSQRESGQFSWEHQTSKLGSVSLNGNYSEVEFDAGQLAYDQSGYGLGISRRFRLGTVSGEVGVSDIKRENSTTFSSNYSNAQLNLKFSDADISLRYVKELTDTSSGLGLNNGLDEEFDSGESNLALVDIVERESLQANYSSSSRNGKSSYVLSYRFNAEDYKTTNEAEERKGVRFSHSYKFSPKWHSEFGVRFTQSDRLDVPLMGVSETKGLNFSIHYRVSKNLRIKAGIDYSERDNGTLGQSNYDELVGFIGFNYQIAPSKTR